jgi:hypothetical protein
MIHPNRPHYLRVKQGRQAREDYRDKDRLRGEGGEGQKAAQQFSRQGEKAKEDRPGYIKGDEAVEEIRRAGNGGLPRFIRFSLR